MSRPLPITDHTRELEALRSQLATLESSIASAESIVEFDYPRGYTPASVEAMRDRLKTVQDWFDTTPPHLRATHSLIELDNLRHRIGILDNYRSMMDQEEGAERTRSPLGGDELVGHLARRVSEGVRDRSNRRAPQRGLGGRG